MAFNTISVTKQRPYLVNNYNKGYDKKEEENETSQSSRTSYTSDTEPQQLVNTDEKKNIQQQLTESKTTHQQAVAARDAKIQNATINIAQILKDFRNTTKAIGASPELTEEVNAYLSLIEKQVQKDTPDIKIVRSNLKNASTLLDNYITETLQRPSKVVENWIDALFLQQINYKFNEEEVNPQFLVKFPNHKQEEENNDSNENEENQEDEEKTSKEAKKIIKIPTDEKLKSLFIQAKKQIYANNSKKAMELFKEALDRAIELDDTETKSMVLFEIGKIYDKNDYLAQALTSYNKSLTTTSDTDIKTKAHYSIAQIYDDVAQFDHAINHYMSSISYAGETENLIAQSTSLTKIGNIYSDEYKKEAFEFLLEADLLAAASSNHKIKGFVSSNIANAYHKFNEPHNALKFYSSAIKEYQEINADEKIAINYKRAAELMQKCNNPQKAESLYKKALTVAKKTNNSDLMKEIHLALNIQ